MSNYERIAATPEKLAKTLFKVSNCPDDSTKRRCDECPLRNAPCGQLIRLEEWLKEECDE